MLPLACLALAESIEREKSLSEPAESSSSVRLPPPDLPAATAAEAVAEALGTGFAVALFFGPATFLAAAVSACFLEPLFLEDEDFLEEVFGDESDADDAELLLLVTLQV